LTFYVIHHSKHLLEDGHNRWPKRVAGFTIYTKMNLRICICTCTSCNKLISFSHHGASVFYYLRCSEPDVILQHKLMQSSAQNCVQS